MVSEFHKGDIILHNFQTGNRKVVQGPHMSVVLHSHQVGNATVTICPISSAVDKRTGKRKKLKSWYLPLNKGDYPCLDVDSYVKTDQIITVDRAQITDIRRPSELICSSFGHE